MAIYVPYFYAHTVGVECHAMKRIRISRYSHVLLLSEHTLCKDSIAIVKKFDFEILTHLYILRPPEFIYAIFAVMYAFICVGVCE